MDKPSQITKEVIDEMVESIRKQLDHFIGEPLTHVALEEIRLKIKELLTHTIFSNKGIEQDKESVDFILKPNQNTVNIQANNLFTALLFLGIYYPPHLIKDATEIALTSGVTYRWQGNSLYRELNNDEYELATEDENLEQ